MGNYDGRARVLWRLSESGIGTTLSASGNSGSFNAATINAVTAVDLRFTTDIWLSAFVAGSVSGASPSLVANLDVYDCSGNLFGAVLATAAISATATGKFVSGGLHSAGATNGQITFPEWGRVSWTVTGTFNGAEIMLLGR